MDPMNSIWYYREFQRQSTGPKEPSQEPLADVSKEMNFDWPDSLPVERIKAGLTEIALAFLLFAAVVTFGLACFLSPTFLT